MFNDLQHIVNRKRVHKRTFASTLAEKLRVRTMRRLLFAAVGVTVAILLYVGIFIIPLWLGGSLITSTVKAATGSCGQFYNVEKFVDGEWFCPSPSR